MSIAHNAHRLNSFRHHRILLKEETQDASRSYQAICSPENEPKYAVLYRCGYDDLFQTTITMCAGRRGVALCAAFPIRCITGEEEENVRALIQAANRQMAVGRLLLQEKCVCFTAGVDTVGSVGEDGMFYLRGGVIYVSKILSALTEVILAAMRGTEIGALVQQLAAAYYTQEGIVQPWMVEPPTAAEIPELSDWLGMLEWWAVCG